MSRVVCCVFKKRYTCAAIFKQYAILWLCRSLSTSFFQVRGIPVALRNCLFYLSLFCYVALSFCCSFDDNLFFIILFIGRYRGHHRHIYFVALRILTSYLLYLFIGCYCGRHRRICFVAPSILTSFLLYFYRAYCGHHRHIYFVALSILTSSLLYYS